MINILLKNSDFIVVEKPHGVIVHPWSECADKTSLMEILKDQTGKWIYPIHRLDRAVSGVMIFAFSSEMAKNIQQVWNHDETQKIYIGLVKGKIIKPMYIDYPLKNQKKTLKQEATTCFWPVDSNEFATLLKFKIKTGRYHQIRRHSSAMANHLIGDTKYGKGGINRFYRENFNLHRLFLHCSGLKIRLNHIEYEFYSPLPEDLNLCCLQLGFRPLCREIVFHNEKTELERFTKLKR